MYCEVSVLREPQVVSKHISIQDDVVPIACRHGLGLEARMRVFFTIHLYIPARHLPIRSFHRTLFHIG